MAKNTNIVIEDGKITERNIDRENFPNLKVIPSEEALDRMASKAESNLKEETKALKDARTQSRFWFRLMCIFSIVGLLVIIVGITLIYSNFVDVGIITTVAAIVPEALAAIYFGKDKELRGVVSLYMKKIELSQQRIMAFDTANSITNETERNDAMRALMNSILRRIE